MSNALINNQTLTDIADAIRAKLGTQDSMLPSEMAGNIREISGGGGGTYQQKTVHPLTTSQTVNPDSGYDALSSVTIEGIELQAKTVTPTGSQQVIEPDSGKDGLSAVTVSAAELQSKTATAGGTSQTITADAGYYGLSSVEVGAISLQSKSATPSGSAQTITPDAGYSGLSSVNVAAVSLQSKNATPSGSTQTITADAGYSGLSSVEVAAISLQSKNVTPSSTSQTVTPDSGYSGLSSVVVAAESQPTLITKSITTNGTYNAEDDNADGYSQVSVNVSGGSPALVLLWTNPNPSSSFAAQTLSLDLSAYKFIVLYGKCAYTTSTSTYPAKETVSQFIRNNSSSYDVVFGGGSGTGSNYAYSYRSVKVTNTGIVFGTGYFRIGTSQQTGAQYAIPTYVYGITVGGA